MTKCTPAFRVSFKVNLTWTKTLWDYNMVSWRTRTGCCHFEVVTSTTWFDWEASCFIVVSPYEIFEDFNTQFHGITTIKNKRKKASKTNNARSKHDSNYWSLTFFRYIPTRKTLVTPSISAKSHQEGSPRSDISSQFPRIQVSPGALQTWHEAQWCNIYIYIYVYIYIHAVYIYIYGGFLKEWYPNMDGL